MGTCVTLALWLVIELDAQLTLVMHCDCDAVGDQTRVRCGMCFNLVHVGEVAARSRCGEAVAVQPFRAIQMEDCS